MIKCKFPTVTTRWRANTSTTTALRSASQSEGCSGSLSWVWSEGHSFCSDWGVRLCGLKDTSLNISHEFAFLSWIRWSLWKQSITLWLNSQCDDRLQEGIAWPSKGTGQKSLEDRMIRYIAYSPPNYFQCILTNCTLCTSFTITWWLQWSEWQFIFAAGVTTCLTLVSPALIMLLQVSKSTHCAWEIAHVATLICNTVFLFFFTHAFTVYAAVYC